MYWFDESFKHYKFCYIIGLTSTHVGMSSTAPRQLRLERSVLESNYSFLVEALVPKDIVPELFAQKLITKSQKEEADSHPQEI